MDYDVVRTHAFDAFKYYKSDDAKYKKSMKNLYAEGRKNPSVASIILDNAVIDGMKKSSVISHEVMKDAKTPDILPLSAHYAQMSEFKTRANIALRALAKGISLTDIPDDKNIQKLAEKQEFDKSFEELYPRTGTIRKRIIDAHRIKMDKVTLKANWFDKISYAKTNGEYRQMYPKSFMARTMLILNNQIKSNEVTKRVSGFFDRLSYLPYVDKSFHFLKTVKK